MGINEFHQPGMIQSPDNGADMYVKYEGDTPVAYAYGEPWIAQALFMDDIGYLTPEEAKEAWEKRQNRTKVEQNRT